MSAATREVPDRERDDASPSRVYCLVAVLGLGLAGCRTEPTHSTKASASASSSGKVRVAPAQAGSTLPPQSSPPPGTPIVEERHALGQRCSFSIYDGSPHEPRKVKKLITCEFQPKSDAPVFEFALRSRLSGDGIESVTITSKETGASQVFAPIHSANSGDIKDVELTDMNFDGYRDLKLLESYGTAGYGYYAIWIYDPGARKYILNEDLRRLANPEPEPATQSIITEPDDPSCRGHDQYRLEGERLALIKRCLWTGRESVTGDWLRLAPDSRKGAR